MSPMAMATLQAAERDCNRMRSLARRQYRMTGMSKRQAAFYSVRWAWPSAVQLVQINGRGPFA